jgi:hypothetical protein
MIENSNDRMSVNILPFFRSSYLIRLEEPGFVDPDLFRLSKPLPEEPEVVDLLRRTLFVEYGRTRDFNIFKSKYQVMKSHFVINDQTLEVRLIRD